MDDHYVLPSIFGQNTTHGPNACANNACQSASPIRLILIIIKSVVICFVDMHDILLTLAPLLSTLLTRLVVYLKITPFNGLGLTFNSYTSKPGWNIKIRAAPSKLID